MKGQFWILLITIKCLIFKWERIRPKSSTLQTTLTYAFKGSFADMPENPSRKKIRIVLSQWQNSVKNPHNIRGKT
jgi:hypothetical protein